MILRLTCCFSSPSAQKPSYFDTARRLKWRTSRQFTWLIKQEAVKHHMQTRKPSLNKPHRDRREGSYLYPGGNPCLIFELHTRAAFWTSRYEPMRAKKSDMQKVATLLWPSGWLCRGCVSIKRSWDECELRGSGSGRIGSIAIDSERSGKNIAWEIRKRAMKTFPSHTWPMPSNDRRWRHIKRSIAKL